MSSQEFYDIILQKNLKVSLLKNSHFTLGTSPYYAHEHGLALDIYHDLSLVNYDVLSPISGKVLKTKKLIAPKAKFKGGIDNDYITLIRNSDESDIVFKILHVKPKVQVGDQIEIGDYIGSTIRNGYFAYWSSPHLHLELRPPNDAVRARGGKDFSLAIQNHSEINQSVDINNIKQIPIEIEAIFPEFLLARFPKDFYYEIKPIFGVRGNINSLNCILDGGIPHYKNGVIIIHHDYNINFPNSVFFGDYKIGTLHKLRDEIGLVKFNPVRFYLNGKEIRGISLFLANFNPLIKLIPYDKSEFFFNSEATQYLSIESIL